MVKSQQKPLNNPNNTLLEYKSTKKTRQQINQKNYQKNKEKIKVRQKERHIQQKQQAALTAQKYYEADSISVLMNLKDYTELNQAKQKLWLNFIWTFKDLNKTGFHDIIQIMKIREEADNLIRDYWETAKRETHLASNWNTSTNEQQAKLIKYWGREKARKEKELTKQLTEQENQAQTLEKGIEIAKFHEERGKIKCQCWKCEQQKQLQAEIKEEIQAENKTAKVECPECGKWVKKLDEENGICKSCVKMYE